MAEKKETVEGYVVDLACIRKYPRDELLERARVHTTRCALMPHCVESGYGLVDHQGGLTALDPAATTRIYDALRGTTREQGVRIRAVRESEDGEMRTRGVEVIPP